MACPRVSYRRRMHYATRGNRMKIVRTPGNRLVMQKRGKRSQGIHTPWVLGHKRLGGTKALNHFDALHANHHEKTVSRPYGGVLSHDQVKDRIIRAFLIEEQRIVKKVLAAEAKFQKLKKKRESKRRRRTEKANAKASAGTGLSASAAAKKAKDAKKATSTKKSKAPIGAKVVKPVITKASAAAAAAAAPKAKKAAPIGAKVVAAKPAKRK